jgi:hypothetical protein
MTLWQLVLFIKTLIGGGQKNRFLVSVN